MRHSSDLIPVTFVIEASSKLFSSKKTVTVYIESSTADKDSELILTALSRIVESQNSKNSLNET